MIGNQIVIDSMNVPVGRCTTVKRCAVRGDRNAVRGTANEWKKKIVIKIV